MLNPSVDAFLLEGCGRCSLGGTPQCKVHSWTQELILLRGILNEFAFVEERKWGVPCYTYLGKNVILLGAFKEFVGVSFLKGALLKDPNHLLELPGENTQVARVIRIRSVKDVMEKEKGIRDLLAQSIEVEKAGKTAKTKVELVLVPELVEALENNKLLKAAFEKLSPGKQRGYNIFFAGAKQSKTRVERIKKVIPKIMEGKGMQD